MYKKNHMTDTKFYYKFDSLVRTIAGERGNVADYIYTGNIYSDKECKTILGDLLVEQLVIGGVPISGYNSSTNTNKTINFYTAQLPEGDVSFRLNVSTAGGKILRQTTENNKIGPFVNGTQKYLKFTANNISVNVLILPDNNTREVTLKRS
jgi:hypothetical protein